MDKEFIKKLEDAIQDDIAARKECENTRKRIKEIESQIEDLEKDLEKERKELTQKYQYGFEIKSTTILREYMRKKITEK
ncbi:MAG: hypothetical protein ACOC3T_00035 [Bacteroidota bacterium]